MVLLLPNPVDSSPTHSKANLLTPGYGEENAVMIVGIKEGVQDS